MKIEMKGTKLFKPMDLKNVCFFCFFIEYMYCVLLTFIYIYIIFF